MSINMDHTANLPLWNSRLVSWRWIVLGAASLVVLIWQANASHAAALKIAVILAGLVAFNILLWRVTREPHSIRFSPQTILVFQVCMDMLAITVMTHFSDSAENPFTMFFVFPVCLVAIVFEKYYWVRFAVLACFLHGSSIMMEYYGILPHYDVFGMKGAPLGDAIMASGILVGGSFTAFSATIFGVGGLVHLLVRQNSEIWSEHHKLEKYVAARERMAQVGEIASGVAHAIRNPLHGLINSTDMLIDEFPDNRDTARHLELMMESLQRMDRITTRLLTLSRNTPMDRQRVDFDAFLSEIIRQATRDLSDNRISVATTLRSDVQAWLDVDRLGEALDNILDNAVRASPEGGEIQVETRAADDMVCVRISDLGVGIEDGMMKKVFTPFFSTRAIGEGSGLGLSIARSVVEKHGGSVVLTHNMPVGTIATISLPCVLEGESL